MSMGKTIIKAEDENDEVLCKQFVRGISKQNITVEGMNIWTVQEVDAYVSAWMKKGYHLVGSPQFMGEIPDGAYMYLYTMVKEIV